MSEATDASAAHIFAGHQSRMRAILISKSYQNIFGNGKGHLFLKKIRISSSLIDSSSKIICEI